MFKTVAIAGTFDHLHKGHRNFILQAFERSKSVIIGLTSDEMANRKSQIPNSKSQIKSNIQKYNDRKKTLENFLKKEGLGQSAVIVEIHNVYGPAILENEIEALIVTRNTKAGAAKVNRRRQELGLTPLKIRMVPLVLASDRKPISSTRIREGEIDRDGNVYINSFSFDGSIPEALRNELKKPQGVILSGNSENLQEVGFSLKREIEKTDPVMIVTVGDQVTRLANEIELPFNIAIIDYRVKRKKIYSSLSDISFPPQIVRNLLPDALMKVRNKPGMVSKSLVSGVKKAYMKFLSGVSVQVIKVSGEEDLAGVPVILFAPLGTVVIYGQPEMGVVVVHVTEEKKKELLDLLSIHL